MKMIVTMYSHPVQASTRLVMAVTRIILPLILLGSQIMNAAADVLATSPQNQTDRFNSLPASFGNPIPRHGMEGLLVVAAPLDGCDPIKPPPKLNDSRSYQFFALIMRGKCEFDVKVINAQNSNYNGAIVFNDESNAVTTMSGKKYARQVFIQSVFVGLNSGSILKGMNYSTGYTVTLSQTQTPSWGYYFLPFISVTSTCVLFFAMYAIAKYVRDQRRQRRARLSRDHLKRLPIKKFKKGDDYDVCAICLDDYEEGQKLRILPCNHAFHCKCIDPWLTNNRRTCPICKRKVVPPGVADSDEESDSEAGTAPNESTPLLAGMENDSTSEHGAIGGTSAITTPPPSPVQLSGDEGDDEGDNEVNNHHGDPPIVTLINVESDSESAGSFPLAEASPDIQVTVHSENELEPMARGSNTV